MSRRPNDHVKKMAAIQAGVKVFARAVGLTVFQKPEGMTDAKFNSILRRAAYATQEIIASAISEGADDADALDELRATKRQKLSHADRKTPAERFSAPSLNSPLLFGSASKSLVEDGNYPTRGKQARKRTISTRDEEQVEGATSSEFSPDEMAFAERLKA